MTNQSIVERAAKLMEVYWHGDRSTLKGTCTTPYAMDLAKYVEAEILRARIDEHTQGCMRCKSEVMMDTGMANCKRIKELTEQLKEIENG